MQKLAVLGCMPACVWKITAIHDPHCCTAIQLLAQQQCTGDQSEHSSLAGGHSHNMVLILFSATCAKNGTPEVFAVRETGLEASDPAWGLIYRNGLST